MGQLSIPVCVSLGNVHLSDYEFSGKKFNILFQMLLRGSNAVGYANYPDNVVREFVVHSSQAGMDVFRIFDSLNYLPNLKVAMEAVAEKTNSLCEAAVCFTGDFTNSSEEKYVLQYYVDLAKELEKMGAHILAIKDMAGLCHPTAAHKLVKTSAMKFPFRFISILMILAEWHRLRC